MAGNMHNTLQEAMRLMQAGDLRAATQAIQRGLGAGAEFAHDPNGAGKRNASADYIDGQYRVAPDSADESVQTPGARESPSHDPNKGPDGEFHAHRFTCDAGMLDYKLFIPRGLGAVAPPLLVMLHGCSQSPDDFARGTRMNGHAQKCGYVVAYPAQAPSRNASKCWNWFRSHDQQRDRGEPALIAELTRHLVKTRGLDERRAYAAGLSAGGAMAAVLANTYPDVFAAIGVHSGLPFGVAFDLPSAFAAMKQGLGTSSTETARMNAVPAIVFHGDQDTTVDPSNGTAVIAQSMGTTASRVAPGSDTTRATVEHGLVSGGRTCTRTSFTDPEGRVVAEQWLVHGAGHAWFGGDPLGSYADASGPDASAHMLRFFSACARSAIN